MMQTKNKPSHKPTICRSFSSILLNDSASLTSSRWVRPAISGAGGDEANTSAKPMPAPVGSRAAISGEKTHAMSDCKEIID